MPLCVFVCVCVYVCVHVCGFFALIHTFVCVPVHPMYVCVCVFVRACMHVRVRACTDTEREREVAGACPAYQLDRIADVC